MLFFLFIQGVEPFVRPTSDSIRIVVQNIDSVTINGVTWENQTRFIPVDKDTQELIISFKNRGTDITLPIQIVPDNDDPEHAIVSRPNTLPRFPIRKPTPYHHLPGMVTGLNRP